MKQLKGTKLKLYSEHLTPLMHVSTTIYESLIIVCTCSLSRRNVSTQHSGVSLCVILVSFALYINKLEDYLVGFQVGSAPNVHIILVNSIRCICVSFHLFEFSDNRLSKPTTPRSTSAFCAMANTVVIGYFTQHISNSKFENINPFYRSLLI